MLAGLAADAVLIVHLLFILFVVLGALLVIRWPGVVWMHLPAVAWAVYIELTGRICPLTPLENHFRQLAGQVGYAGGFIERYLLPVIYPAGLDRPTQWLLGGGVILINLIAYGFVLTRRRQRPN